MNNEFDYNLPFFIHDKIDDNLILHFVYRKDSATIELGYITCLYLENGKVHKCDYYVRQDVKKLIR